MLQVRDFGEPKQTLSIDAQWCVVEVTKEFYQKGTSVHLWTAHAKTATRSWAAVTRWDPNQPVMSPAAGAKRGRSRADQLMAEAEKPAPEQNDGRSCVE